MGREPQRLPAGREVGYEAWLEQQLHPRPAVLPAAAQAQIDALTISQKPMQQLVQELEAQRRDYDKAMADDEAKKPRSAPTSRS
jgi:phosphatidylserine/phosphatidylglycerophosphate/cardiolipin synthase-like enzyme